MRGKVFPPEISKTVKVQVIMKKECINKLECRFPTLFRALWYSVAIWLVVSVVNYYGHWLAQSKIDDFGMGIIIILAISMSFCFGMGIRSLVSQQEVLTIKSTTKKVASIVFMLSFSIILVLSIWSFCKASDNPSDLTRNGRWGSSGILFEAIYAIIANIAASGFFSIAAIVFYVSLRLGFTLFFGFSGRIRRVVVEIALALIIMVLLSLRFNDQFWVNAIVVLTAVTFLYDIWSLADFKEEQIDGNWIKRLFIEED